MNTLKNKLSFSELSQGTGLKNALSMSRAKVISKVSASGIRGRGGAGFPVSVKWNLCGLAHSDRKFVVCNADEGEPGTFKDRVILDEYASLVFDGMTIAAYAVGASEGILYLRAEYVYLREKLEEALRRRRKDGLLGKQILGSNLNFDIHIFMGGGAYVCGEETALIESLEGKRGEPRNRPPFPIDMGYLNHPTVVNNVETLAWITCIFEKGASWFKEQGTEGSVGPKLFSVSGDCTKPGVYEFPLGISVLELLAQTGGENAKCVQVGGASGHLVPASEFCRHICFEDMATGGSVIIFGQNRKALDIAENFMEFFEDESCGQCTPCRDGNAKLLEGIRMLKNGACKKQRFTSLLNLAETMQLASRCGLGQSSPNIFLDVIKHFHTEFELTSDATPDADCRMGA
ncbi:MAG: SLBB domain-containing protein [Deltaproteobacteria bacterium]|nr:SLBB domain-containing protein [Deltaproteobacteria bacterium]